MIDTYLTVFTISHFRLRVPYGQKIIIFIIRFYGIMHRTTIVQNKILRIINLFLPFFCQSNIYRPSQGKVRLGRPNPKQLQWLNFYPRGKRKKPFLLRIACTTTYRSPIFNFDFHLFKKIFKNVYQKTWQFFSLYI